MGWAAELSWRGLGPWKIYQISAKQLYFPTVDACLASTEKKREIFHGCSRAAHLTDACSSQIWYRFKTAIKKRLSSGLRFISKKHRYNREIISQTQMSLVSEICLHGESQRNVVLSDNVQLLLKTRYVWITSEAAQQFTLQLKRIRSVQIWRRLITYRGNGQKSCQRLQKQQ